MNSQINLVVLLWKGYRFYFLLYLVNVNIVLAPQQKKKNKQMKISWYHIYTNPINQLRAPIYVN